MKNSMQYKIFGRRTGLRVSELALGTRNSGTGWGYGTERDEASTTTLLPIVGPRTRAQLDGYLGALAVTLSSEQTARLTVASAVPLGTPHEQIAATAEGIAGGDTRRLTAPSCPPPD